MVFEKHSLLHLTRSELIIAVIIKLPCRLVNSHQHFRFSSYCGLKTVVLPSSETFVTIYQPKRLHHILLKDVSK